MVKKLTSRQKQALADQTMQAADAATKAAQDRFGRQIKAAFAEITTFLAGRRPRDLSGADAVTLMSLKARLDGLTLEQKHFAEASPGTD
jgi:hypothetical protein